MRKLALILIIGLMFMQQSWALEKEVEETTKPNWCRIMTTATIATGLFITGLVVADVVKSHPMKITNKVIDLPPVQSNHRSMHAQEASTSANTTIHSKCFNWEKFVPRFFASPYEQELIFPFQVAGAGSPPNPKNVLCHVFTEHRITDGTVYSCPPQTRACCDSISEVINEYENPGGMRPVGVIVYNGPSKWLCSYLGDLIMGCYPSPGPVVMGSVVVNRCPGTV